MLNKGNSKIVNALVEFDNKKNLTDVDINNMLEEINYIVDNRHNKKHSRELNLKHNVGVVFFEKIYYRIRNQSWFKNHHYHYLFKEVNFF